MHIYTQCEVEGDEINGGKREKGRKRERREEKKSSSKDTERTQSE